jgi:hypothetical protein
MILIIDFDANETYQTGAGSDHLGPGAGYGSLEGYKIENGMVVLDFGNGKFRKIPARRLLRITEA